VDSGQWTVDHCAHTAATGFGTGWCGTDAGNNLFSIVTTDVFRNVSTDYHLKAASVCIDSGVTDATNIPSATDMFGTTRPRGSAWDMGVHEVVSSSNVTRDFIAHVEFRSSFVKDMVPTPISYSQSLSVDSGDLPTSWAGPPGGGGALSVDVVLVIEALSTMPTIRTPLNSFTDDFTPDFGDPDAAIGTFLLDPALPIEWGETVNNRTVDSRMPIEWRATTQRSWTAPIGWGVGVVRDAALPVATQSTRFVDSVVPSDRAASVVRDAALPMDFINGFSISLSCAMPMEWGAGRHLTAMVMLPIDHASETRRDATLHSDWRIEGVTVSATFAIEYVRAVTASHILPPETLASRAVGYTLPGEHLGSRVRDVSVAMEPGARVQRDATPQIEWGAAAQGGAASILPVEHSAQLQVAPALAAEWRGTLLRDHQMLAAWSLTVRADAQLSASWTGILRADNRVVMDWTQDTKPTGASTVIHLEMLSTVSSTAQLTIGLELGRLSIGAATTPDKWEADHEP
jgi:hypothetical protein